MKIMLDTNICIALIKRKPTHVLQKMQTYVAGDVCISSITLAELRFGASKSQHSAKNHATLDKFLLPLDIADFDEAATRHYGELRSTLEKQGTPIGALDTLIAAHALSLNLPLVTHNTREFNRVAGLQVEDWISQG
ncbi:MAG: type II toxin-antitoxin system VapC family toxin [Gallionella sp.]